MVAMQAIRAFAPLSIATEDLTAFVTQGEFLGDSKVGRRIMLVSTLVALVAGAGQMIEVAEIATLSSGLGIKGPDRRVVGAGKTLVNTLVCGIEQNVLQLWSGGLLGVEVDDKVGAQLGSTSKGDGRRWYGGRGSTSGGGRGQRVGVCEGRVAGETGLFTCQPWCSASLQTKL